MTQNLFHHHQHTKHLFSLFYSLSPFTTSCEFAQFVSTEQGALLAKEMALASIRTTTKSDSSNNYGFVSDFLMNHCSAFLGEYNITYYKVKNHNTLHVMTRTH
jgi:hypothetical protein